MPNLSFDIFWRDHGAEKGVKALGNETEKTGKKVAKSSKGIAVGMLGASTAIVGFGISSVKAYTEAETSSNNLQESFRKFPKLADVSITSLQDLNTALSKKTKFDDDATASGQSVLATFGLTGKQITQLTPLLQDYAAKTGKDIPGAAKDLGKAVLGQGKALKNVGIQFTDTKDKGKNFEEVMGGLRTQVGGFAEVQGKSAAGQAAIMENQFGELQETVGSKLVPVLIKLGGRLLSIIDFVSRNSAVITPLVIGIGSLVATVWAVNKAAKAYAATQEALNVILTMNPIGLVIAAVALLVTGLVIAYKKSDTFRHVVNAAFVAVSRACLDMAGTVIHGAANAFGWMPGIGPKLKNAAKHFDTFRDSVNASLNRIQDENVVVSINTAAKIYGTAGGHYEGSTYIPDKRANGGAMRKALGSYRSDSIPTMLSYDEHVWTANEVHAAGGHSAVESMRKGVLSRASGGRIDLSLVPNLPGG